MPPRQDPAPQPEPAQPAGIDTVTMARLLSGRTSHAQYQRDLVLAERGPMEARRLDLEARVRFAERQYREAVTAAGMRLRAGSLQRYQLVWLAECWRRWRIGADEIDAYLAVVAAASRPATRTTTKAAE